jgi:multisubunit Na+/H+ antiporter MnhG subunit
VAVTGQEVAVAALLGLAVLVTLASAVGTATAPSALARMHFLGPVTGIAAPAVGIAVVIQRWPALGTGAKALVVAAVLFAGGPLVLHVLARADRARSRR